MLRKSIVEICHNRRIIAYAFGVLTCFLFFALFWDESIYGDAAGYSFMAQQFIKYGLGNFKLQLESGSGEELLFSLRGYAWPWLIALFRIISLQSRAGWWIIYSLFISFGFTFLLPEIFEQLFKKELNCVVRVIPLLLTLFIWPGLVIYTLSDIPSIIFMELGLYAILLICKKNLRFMVKLALGLLAGFSLGFSYYIRSGNMVCVTLALLALIIYSFKKSFVKKILIIFVFCLGIGVSTIPQIVINVSCNHKFSYEVPIFFTSEIRSGEYFSGVTCLRYETVISENYPEITAIAKDNFAESLFRADGIPSSQIDAFTLAGGIFRHPMEYLGIFSAKFANFIESRFGEIYIKDFKYGNNGKVVFSFILYYMSFAGMLYLLSRKNDDKKILIGKSIELTNFIEFVQKHFLYICIFLAPSLVHIAGTHVESRYIFGLQLFLWQFLAAIVPWREMASRLWNHVLSYFLLFIVLLGCCSAIWNYTLEQLPFYEYCLQREPEKTYLSYEEFGEKYIIAADGQYESCVNSFNYEESRLDLYGYIFMQGHETGKDKYTLCFTKEGAQYYYEINTICRYDVAQAYGDSRYEDSGIWFSNYLFDLAAGTYDVGIIIEEGQSAYYVDLLYDVEVD